MGFVEEVLLPILINLVKKIVGFCGNKVLEIWSKPIDYKRGYFDIAYRNIGFNYFTKEAGPLYHFDLNDNVSFQNMGSDTLTLKRIRIEVNGNKTFEKICDEQYTSGGGFWRKSINFGLNEVDKKENELNIKIYFEIENFINQIYVQEMKMNFICYREYQNTWVLRSCFSKYVKKRKVNKWVNREKANSFEI